MRGLSRRIMEHAEALPEAVLPTLSEAEREELAAARLVTATPTESGEALGEEVVSGPIGGVANQHGAAGGEGAYNARDRGGQEAPWQDIPDGPHVFEARSTRSGGNRPGGCASIFASCRWGSCGTVLQRHQEVRADRQENEIEPCRRLVCEDSFHGQGRTRGEAKGRGAWLTTDRGRQLCRRHRANVKCQPAGTDPDEKLAKDSINDDDFEIAGVSVAKPRE